jgi:hypothetical protein
MPTLRGRCHCGALEVALTTNSRPAGLPVRACQCSFCRRHGGLSTSDPNGQAEFTANDPSALVRYQFGLKMTDFWICGRCGCYLGAVMEESWAVINVNVLDDRDAFTGHVEKHSYEGETVEERRARRLKRWTPASVTQRP